LELLTQEEPVEIILSKPAVMKREDILAVYEAGPEAVIELINTLMETILGLSEQNTELRGRVKALEDQLNQNSRNSNKPPSTDGFAKPKSQRKMSDKPVGGQKGHPGYTLKMVDEPDHTIIHPVSRCSKCGRSLEGIQATGYERRQVFDLPPVKVEVTEHRAEEKLCPNCGYLNKAAFPEEVKQPVQYGSRLKGTAVYLSQYQLLPYERTSELFDDLFGRKLSQASLVNANQACYEILEPVEKEIKQQVIDSAVVNFDETGLKVNGKQEWLHVASTERLTCYAAHPKRGQEAMDDMGILPGFQGTAVHDLWKSYFKYDCRHALCNAHHLRELTGAQERDKQEWPEEVKSLLLEIKETVEEAKPIANQLDPAQLKSFAERYDQIIEKGLAENPVPISQDQTKRRGRKKQSKAKNLLDRLKEHSRETLAFMYDFNAPFDNNQAERDIRMVKTQQKISGTFRSAQGADVFCRIRGYISTVKKNSLPVIAAVQAAFEGSTFIPARAGP
jgi:transposase